MKRLIFLCIILVLGLFQVTFLNYFKIFSIKPDLLLITVVLAGINFDLKWALFFSIFAGILKDAFVVNAFGINTVMFALWSFFIARLNKKLSIDNNFIYTTLIIILVILNSVITRVIFFYSGKFIPVGTFLQITFFESVYTALILPLIFKVVKFWRVI